MSGPRAMPALLVNVQMFSDERPTTDVKDSVSLVSQQEYLMPVAVQRRECLAAVDLSPCSLDIKTDIKAFRRIEH